MSSEMVERIARGLRRRRYQRSGEGITMRYSEPLTVDEIADAQGAIEEMRIPTNKMLSVGRHGPAGDVLYDRDAEIVWTDMIDEAAST